MRSLLICVLIGGGIAAAFLAPKALYVNGAKSTKPIIEQGGEVYIPVSALSAAGADVNVNATRVSVQFKPVKTKMEQEYVEGVLDEWVSNGVWRFRVSNVKPLAENPIGTHGNGFSVDFEARTTSTKMVQLAYSGVLGVQLLDSDERRGAVTGNSFPGYMADIQPGGGFKNTLLIGSDGGETLKDAAKLIIQFDKPLKSVRINLKPE